MYLGGTTLPPCTQHSVTTYIWTPGYLLPPGFLTRLTLPTYLTTTLLHINDTARQKVVDGAGAFVEAPSTA